MGCDARYCALRSSGWLVLSPGNEGLVEQRAQLLLESINPGMEFWAERSVMEASCHALLGTAEGKRLPPDVQLVLTPCVDGECMSCFLQHDLASAPNSI